MMDRESIDAKTLREWLESGEEVTVVDVRREDDYSEWSVPGSVNLAAHDQLKAGDPGAMEGLDVPRDRPVVTVCGAGRSSAVAAEQLRKRGFDALTLEGGMKSWSLAWNTAEVELPGTEARVIQVRRTGKGCLSYLIGSDGEATVVDAAVDPEVYLGLAEERGWKISRVLDTHVHADHLSRSGMLADLSGATLHTPERTPVSYPFSPLGDGDETRIGAAMLRALRTPGHTAESTSYLLDGRGPQGGALFTGDTLFLAAVGRPDLEASPEGVREKARALHAPCAACWRWTGGRSCCPGTRASPSPSTGSPWPRHSRR